MAFIRHTHTEREVTVPPPPHETIYTAPEMREPPVHERREPRNERMVAGLLSGGGMLEVLAGAGAVALSIIALAGAAPYVLGAISAICIGGALLLFSGAVGARWRDTGGRVKQQREEGADVIGGMGAMAIGGAGGVVLGILTLVGLAPVVLFSIAVICLGGGMLLGGAGQTELDAIGNPGTAQRARFSGFAMKSAGGIMAIAGIGGIVLGILGVIGVGDALALALVGTLAMGGGLVLAGAAATLRFGTAMLQHRTA